MNQSCISKMYAVYLWLFQGLRRLAQCRSVVCVACSRTCTREANVKHRYSCRTHPVALLLREMPTVQWHNLLPRSRTSAAFETCQNLKSVEEERLSAMASKESLLRWNRGAIEMEKKNYSGALDIFGSCSDPSAKIKFNCAMCSAIQKDFRSASAVR